MRIGLFTDTYVPIHNGISYVVEMTRKGLEARGHEVYIFAPKPYADYEEDDTHVIRYRALKGVTYNDDLTSLFFPPRELQKINKLKLDIIQFYTPNQIGLLGLMAGLRYEIPVISQYSTDIYEYVDYYPAAEKVILAFPIAAPIVLGGRWKSWSKAVTSLPKHPHVKSWLKTLTAEYITSMHDKCSAVIVLSKKHKQQLTDWGTKSAIHMISTGVDPLPVATAGQVKAYRKQQGFTDSDKVILYAGRISKEKNLDLLLDAFLEHVAPKDPHAKLHFAGDFDYREALEAKTWASEYPERVVFSGAYQRDKAGVIYGAADIFAFPSLTDTQGLVINEAAGAGLPLVMCDAEVSDVFVKDETGLLAGTTPVMLADALLELLKDEKKRKQLAQNAKKRAAEFSEETQIAKLEQLYQKCKRDYKKLTFAGGNW